MVSSRHHENHLLRCNAFCCRKICMRDAIDELIRSRVITHDDYACLTHNAFPLCLLARHIPLGCSNDGSFKRIYRSSAHDRSVCVRADDSLQEGCTRWDLEILIAKHTSNRQKNNQQKNEEKIMYTAEIYHWNIFSHQFGTYRQLRGK